VRDKKPGLSTGTDELGIGANDYARDGVPLQNVVAKVAVSTSRSKESAIILLEFSAAKMARAPSEAPPREGTETPSPDRQRRHE
jgi:hypothetical protein